MSGHPAGKRSWTPDEDAVLRRRYPHEPTAVLAKVLNRTVRALYDRAEMLGVRKTEAFLQSPAACHLRRGTQVGKATQFKKGQVPANKGTRRPGWAPGRMAETQFQPGTMPHNWVPIGSETYDGDGYLKRKIADDRTRPSRFNWIYVHVLVWEAAHEPVPKGHCVAFKNGDKTDLRLDNLECITRRERMRRNTVHNLPKELASAVQLLGALTRKIRRNERAQEQDRRPAESPVRSPRATQRQGGSARRGARQGDR